MGRAQAAGAPAPASGQGRPGRPGRARGAALKLYLDTSALVKLYVAEEGSPAVRAAVGGAEWAATSMIAYVEARAAFARRRRERVLPPRAYRRIVRALDADWEHYLRVEVSESLVRAAAETADTHGLRAYDALHLASADLLRDRTGEPVLFAAWDADLETAARRHGFELLRR